MFGIKHVTYRKIFWNILYSSDRDDGIFEGARKIIGNYWWIPRLGEKWDDRVMKMKETYCVETPEIPK